MIPNCTELRLNDGDSCGIRATCDSNLLCQCQFTFIRTSDFGSGNQTDCLGQTTVLLFIYSVYLILIGISISLYLGVITKPSQLKRLVPFLMGMVGCGIAGILKITNLEDRPIGEDITVTILIAIALPASHLSNLINGNKYLSLQNKLAPFLAESYERQLNIRKNVLIFCTFLSLIGALVYLSTPFLNNNYHRIVLFRVAFGILALAAFGFTYAYTVIGIGFQRDIKEHSITADLKLQDVVTRSRDVRNIGSIFFFMVGVTYLSGTVSEKALFFGSYIIPIQLSLMFLSTILTLMANIRKIGGREAPVLVRARQQKIIRTRKKSNPQSIVSML